MVKVISIVVPTFNEAEVIEKFVTRVCEVMNSFGREYEVLVVDDDSPDKTGDIVRKISKKNNNVKVFVRKNNFGLSAAVVDGFRKSHGKYLVVMDADFQHPPESIPDLVRALDKHEFAVGSRKIRGGGDKGRHFYRRFVSDFSNFFTRFVLWLPVSDPMTGFFGLRREAFLRSKPFIKPRGYKVMLELLVKSRTKDVVQVPFIFQKRLAGKTKARPRIFLCLLVQIIDNFLFRTRHFFN
jgi:dolichol-phosphate mannosyltransferase